MLDFLSEPIKLTLDAAATIFAFAVWLTTVVPAITAVISLAWVCVRFYDYLKERKKNGDQRLD